MIESDCFALLDDALSADGVAASRLYRGLVEDLRCDDPAVFNTFWSRVTAAQCRGLHAVVLGDYEWAARLQGLASQGGCFRVLLFSSLQRMTSREVAEWLALSEAKGRQTVEPTRTEPAGLGRLMPSVSPSEFAAAVASIHEAIRAGETYQVNYTFRLDGDYFGSPLGLYRRLRSRQPVGYGALIALPPADGERSYVLSCSPELFIEHRDGVLRTRPMKGTAARSGEPSVDADRAQALACDPKNRAENLMIVDLLRNDMGQVAETGSVRVSQLFHVEHYATVLQMTSTVEARVRPDVGFPDVLCALFPCGSITGAPKLQTMRHIERLESRPRGLYTGCLGWVDRPDEAQSAALGEFCLSVPIRTLLLTDPEGGRKRVELGVGAGIVIDSEAETEYQECMLKARFASALDPGFELFETLRVTADRKIAARALHLARLVHSAGELGFACRLDEINVALDEELANLPAGQAWRMRLSLSFDGNVSLACTPLDALDASPLRLLLAPGPMLSMDGLLRHKTTRRAVYDEAICHAVADGAFDMLFYDQQGRVTEGARSNVFVFLDGQWLTPPLESGMVLPGTMRAQLLEDASWNAREAALTLSDLARADRVVVTNALRGACEAQVEGDALGLMGSLAELPRIGAMTGPLWSSPLS